MCCFSLLTKLWYSLSIIFYYYLGVEIGLSSTISETANIAFKLFSEDLSVKGIFYVPYTGCSIVALLSFVYICIFSSCVTSLPIKRSNSSFYITPTVLVIVLLPIIISKSGTKPTSLLFPPTPLRSMSAFYPSFIIVLSS